MTRDEAARILTALASPWPNMTIAADTAEVWFHSELSDLGFDAALAVVMRLVETEERFPTIARFKEMRRAVIRRATEGEPKQITEGVLERSAGSRWARIAKLIRRETPSAGDLRNPRVVAPVHARGESPNHCQFCQDRFRLSDAELDARLAASEAS